MTLEFVLVASRFMHFGASMLVFGAALFPVYAGWGANFPMRTAAIVATVSALAWFSCVLVSVAGDPAAAFSFEEARLVLLTSSFGHAWFVHLVLVAFLIGATFARQRITIAVAAGLHLASLTWIGHAASGDGIAHIAHLLGQVTHLFAAGIWLGGLIPLWQALRDSSERERSKLVRRFSTMGYGAVALVALTGTINVWFITGDFVPSLSSTYGQLIALKLGLVTLLLVIVLFNQFYAARQRRWSILRQGIAGELGLFAGVLFVVGLLGVTPPMS